MLLTYDIGSEKCGTYITGYYDGTIPPLGLPYTSLNGAIRFSYAGNPSYYAFGASVTNCGSYYVWYLHSGTGCQAAWCVV